MANNSYCSAFIEKKNCGNNGGQMRKREKKREKERVRERGPKL